MTQNDSRSKSIEYLRRRLEKLREQESLYGAAVDPSIVIQIEDIERILGSSQSETEFRKEISKIFFKEEIDYESLAKAIDFNKEELLVSLEKGIKYEIELLRAPDTLTLILINNSGEILQTLSPSPSREYVKALSAYMKRQRYNSHKIDSYVTPYVLSRTKRVFLDFYSSMSVQDSISRHLKNQLEQAKNKLSNSIYVDYKGTIERAIDKLLNSGLREFS